jgi:hypothetical protein
MSEFALKTLEFGVLGLCAITLILVWRLILAEQRREGNPRGGILQASYVFMAFCLALALLNGYVQLRETELPGNATQQIELLESQLRQSQDKLLEIRSAAEPILFARSNILDRLPPGPERDTLRDLVNSLRAVLQ